MAFTLFTGVDYSPAPDDAWFRGFKGLSDALTAVGFVKTTDTGQVNWASATAAAGGYEIRTIAGAGMTLVYVRLGYSTSGLSVQLGIGSDGAGHLVGPNHVLAAVCIPEAAGSGKTTWALSYDDYGFALIAGGSTAVNRYFLAVESLRGEDGSALPGQMAVLRSTGPGMGECDGTWFDLLSQTWQTYRSLPISYFDTVTDPAQSSNYSQSYYFSAPILLTPTGIGRTRLLIGLNQSDFMPGGLLQVPRFGQEVATPYLFYKPEAGPGCFGPSDYAYCAPALYWA